MIGAFILTACAPSQGATPAPTEAVPPQETETMETTEEPVELSGTAWRLASMGLVGSETPVIEGSTVTLQFNEDGTAGGQGGCNSYGGSYQVEEGEITFVDVVSTLMACADETVTQQETAYLNALQHTGQFELSTDSLVIFYNDGAEALRFTPTAAMQ